MKYKDLREFVDKLEEIGELKRIKHPVDPNLEMTEMPIGCSEPKARRCYLKTCGSFCAGTGYLFGTPRRVALGMGEDNVSALREIGQLLAFLKEPKPPKGFKAALQTLPMYRKVLDMSPKVVKRAPCQKVVWEGDEVDLNKLPIQTCWPEDAGPLITWGW